mmetsp:Transcript_20907/g.29217  ORF Transcript_20907/g.29217 Transcript_20907/m.29217 type:complete len:459 (-) Transcript_20907:703-2079(-)
MKFSSATVLLWILSFTCLLHLASAGGQVIPIDISEHMNFDMLGLNPDYPRGEVKFADIPFTLVEEGFTGWSSGNGGFGGNIYPGTWTMTIDVGIYGVSKVYTLLNSGWGTTQSGWLIVEFFGSSGAYLRADLRGNREIRDHALLWTSRIDSPNTRNVFFDATGRGGRPNVIDMQTFTLPSEFQKQMLNSVRITDRRQPFLHTARLLGVSVQLADKVTHFVPYRVKAVAYTSAKSSGSNTGGCGGETVNGVLSNDLRGSRCSIVLEKGQWAKYEVTTDRDITLRILYRLATSKSSTKLKTKFGVKGGKLSSTGATKGSGQGFDRYRDFYSKNVFLQTNKVYTLQVKAAKGTVHLAYIDLVPTVHFVPHRSDLRHIIEAEDYHRAVEHTPFSNALQVRSHHEALSKYICDRGDGVEKGFALNLTDSGHSWCSRICLTLIRKLLSSCFIPPCKNNWPFNDE